MLVRVPGGGRCCSHSRLARAATARLLGLPVKLSRPFLLPRAQGLLMPSVPVLVLLWRLLKKRPRFASAPGLFFTSPTAADHHRKQ
jgi:hypothetical protein